MTVLESGDIHFLFRPTVDETDPSGLPDVRNFVMVLAPRGERRRRLITVGKKRLPDTEQDERLWGYVAAVYDDPDALADELGEHQYTTRTQGERLQPAARPVGSGTYALVARRRRTELAYVLALPQEPGEVQREFNLLPEASYTISVKNPQAGSPPELGLDDEEQAEFSEELQARFDGRRWAPVDPSAFLDHAGAEILLIGTSDDVSGDDELDVEADDTTPEDMLAQLRLDAEQHPVEPLVTGAWA